MENSEVFSREYFENGTKGYRLYRDFPCHWKTVEIILERKPKSVLEVGGARGYIVKKLEDQGVKATCMDVSKHCWHTRATNSFVLHDATKKPWPFKDKEFDLCFSIAFLEHVPEDKVDTVIEEMCRVANRRQLRRHNISQPLHRTPHQRRRTKISKRMPQSLKS